MALLPAESGGSGQVPVPQPTPKPRPKYNLFRSYESRAAQKKAQRKKQELLEQRRLQADLRHDQLRTRLISSVPSSRAAVQTIRSDAEEQRRFQLEQRKKQRPSSAFAPQETIPAAKPAHIFNPFDKHFDDPERATRTLSSLPLISRIAVFSAIDPNDTTPLAAFGETTRDTVLKARLGSTDALELLINDKNAIDEITNLNRQRIAAEKSYANQEARQRLQEAKVPPLKKSEIPHPTQFSPRLNLPDQAYIGYFASKANEGVTLTNINRKGSDEYGNARFDVTYKDNDTGIEGTKTLTAPTDEVNKFINPDAEIEMQIGKATSEYRTRTFNKDGTSPFPAQIKALYALHPNQQDSVVDVVSKGFDNDGYEKFEVELRAPSGRTYKRTFTNSPGAINAIASQAGYVKPPLLPKTENELELMSLTRALETSDFYRSVGPSKRGIGGDEYSIYSYKNRYGVEAEIQVAPDGQSNIVYNINYNDPMVKGMLDDVKKADNLTDEQAKERLQGYVHFSMIYSGEIKKFTDKGLSVDENTKEGKKNVEEANRRAGTIALNGLSGEARKLIEPEEPQALGGVAGAFAKVSAASEFYPFMERQLKKLGVYKLLGRPDYEPVTAEEMHAGIKKGFGWAPEEVQGQVDFALSPMGLYMMFFTPLAAAKFGTMIIGLGQAGLAAEKLGADPQTLPIPSKIASNAIAGGFAAQVLRGFVRGGGSPAGIGIILAGLAAGGLGGQVGALNFGEEGDFTVGPRSLGQWTGMLAGAHTPVGQTALRNFYKDPASLKRAPAAIRNAPFFTAIGRLADRQLYNRGLLSERIVNLKPTDPVEIISGDNAGAAGVIEKLGRKNHTIKLEDGTTVKVADQNLKYSVSRSGEVIPAEGEFLTLDEATQKIQQQIDEIESVPSPLQSAENFRLRKILKNHLKDLQKEQVRRLQARTEYYKSPDVEALDAKVFVRDLPPDNYVFSGGKELNFGEGPGQVYYISKELAGKSASVIAQKIQERVLEDFEAAIPPEVKALREAGQEITSSSELFTKAAETLGLKAESLTNAAKTGGWKLITADGAVFAETSEAAVNGFQSVMRQYGAPIEGKGVVIIGEGTGGISVKASDFPTVERAREYLQKRASNLPDETPIIFELGEGNTQQVFGGTAKQIKEGGWLDIEDPLQYMGSGALEHIPVHNVRRVLKNLLNDDLNKTATSKEQGLEREEQAVLDELQRTGRTPESVLIEVGDWESFGRDPEILQRMADEKATKINIYKVTQEHAEVEKQYMNAHDTESGLKIVDLEDNSTIKFRAKIAKEFYTNHIGSLLIRYWDAINQSIGPGQRIQQFEGFMTDYGAYGVSYRKLFDPGTQAVFVNLHKIFLYSGGNPQMVARYLIHTLVHEGVHRNVAHVPGEAGDVTFVKAFRKVWDKYREQYSQHAADLEADIRSFMETKSNDWFTLTDDALQYEALQNKHYETFVKAREAKAIQTLGGYIEDGEFISRGPSRGLAGSARRAAESARSESISDAARRRGAQRAARIRERYNRAKGPQSGLAGRVTVRQNIPYPGTADGLGWTRTNDRIRAYHGTQVEFEGFPEIKSERAAFGPAIYVTETPSIADVFAGVRTRPVLTEGMLIGGRVYPFEIAGDASIFRMDETIHAIDIKAIENKLSPEQFTRFRNKLEEIQKRFIEESDAEIKDFLRRGGYKEGAYNGEAVYDALAHSFSKEPVSLLENIDLRTKATNFLKELGYDAIYSPTEGRQYAILNKKVLRSAITQEPLQRMRGDIVQRWTTTRRGRMGPVVGFDGNTYINLSTGDILGTTLKEAKTALKKLDTEILKPIEEPLQRMQFTPEELKQQEIEVEAIRNAVEEYAPNDPLNLEDARTHFEKAVIASDGAVANNFPFHIYGLEKLFPNIDVLNELKVQELVRQGDVVSVFGHFYEPTEMLVQGAIPRISEATLKRVIEIADATGQTHARFWTPGTKEIESFTVPIERIRKVKSLIPELRRSKMQHLIVRPELREQLRGAGAEATVTKFEQILQRLEDKPISKDKIDEVVAYVIETHGVPIHYEILTRIVNGRFGLNLGERKVLNSLKRVANSNGEGSFSPKKRRIGEEPPLLIEDPIQRMGDESRKFEQILNTRSVGDERWVDLNDRPALIIETGGKIDLTNTVAMATEDRLLRKVVINREGDTAYNILDHGDGINVLRPEIDSWPQIEAEIERGNLSLVTSDYFNKGEVTIEASPLRVSQEMLTSLIKVADATDSTTVRFWESHTTAPEESLVIPVARLRNEGIVGLTKEANRNRIGIALRKKAKRYLRPDQYEDPIQHMLDKEYLERTEFKEILLGDNVIVRGKGPGSVVGLTPKGFYRVQLIGKDNPIIVKTKNNLTLMDGEARKSILDELEMPLPRRKRLEKIQDIEDILTDLDPKTGRPKLKRREANALEEELKTLNAEENTLKKLENEFADEVAIKTELYDTIYKLTKQRVSIGGPRELQKGDRIKINSGKYRGRNADLIEQTETGWKVRTAGKSEGVESLSGKLVEVTFSQINPSKKGFPRAETATHAALKKRAGNLMYLLETKTLPITELWDELPTHQLLHENTIAVQMPEIELLQSHYDGLLREAANAKAAGNATRLEEINAQMDAVFEQLEEIRSEASGMAVISSSRRELPSTFERISPPFEEDPMAYVRSTFRLNDQEQQQVTIAPKAPFELAAKVPGLRRVVGVFSPGIVHVQSWLGRRKLAFDKMNSEAKAKDDAYYNAMLEAKPKDPLFKFDRFGREKVTGHPMGDVFEKWWEGRTDIPMSKRQSGIRRQLFLNDPRLAEMDAYFDIVNRGRLEALQDARRFGQTIPPDWFEDLHAFRDVISRDGKIDIRAAIRSSKAKPGSFRHRYYEEMIDGVAGGINYNTDFEHVMTLGASQIRSYAINKAFLRLIANERGVPMKLFTAQETRREAAIAKKQFAYAKVLQKYAHDSLTAHPAKPRVQTGRSASLTPYPQEIIQLFDEINAMNRRGLTGGAKKRALSNYVQRADNIHDAYQSTLKKAQKDLKWAKEDVNHAVQLSDFFPQNVIDEYGFKPSEWVDVSPAPISKFPELSNKLFIKQDVDWLLRNVAKTDNIAVKFAYKVRDITGVMRTFQTTYDFGFWMIQGLGLISMDFGRLISKTATGHPIEGIKAFPIGGTESAFSKAWWNGVKAFLSKESSARWWEEMRISNPEVFADWQRYARISGYAEDLFDIGKLEQLEKATIGQIPILNKLQPTKRLGRSMSTFLNAGAFETFKALHPLAKNAQQLEELGAFVRNLSGRAAVLDEGMHEGQLAVERALLYAPSFTRAGLAIMAKAVFDPLSFGGRQAIKSLAGLTAAMLLFGTASAVAKQMVDHNGNIDKMDWDDLASDVKDTMNPFNLSTFASTRVGSFEYGFGGNIRGNISLLSRLVRASVEDDKALMHGDLSQLLTARPWDKDLSPIDLENGKPWVNFEHPFIRWLRGKTSPAVSMGWDIFSGKTFMGMTLDSTSDYLKLPERLLPLSVQQMLQTDVGWKERLGVGFAEFLGIRTTPISKFQLYKEQVERDLDDTYDNLKGTEYLKQAQVDKENFPELAHRYNDFIDYQRDTGDEKQQLFDYVEKRRVERDQELLKLADKIDWTRPGGGENYIEQARFIKARYLDDYSQKAEALGIDLNEFGGTGEEDANADKLLGDQLDAIVLEDYVKQDGTPDYDAWEAAREKVISKMSQREQKAVREKKYTSLHDASLAEVERRRDKAADLWGPYKTAPKYIGLTQEEGKQLDQVMQLLSQMLDMQKLRNPKAKVPDRRTILRRALANPNIDAKARMFLTIALISTYDSLRPLILDDSRTKLVLNNPDFAVFYPGVYYDLDEEERAAWDEKYSSRRGVPINYGFIENPKYATKPEPTTPSSYSE